MNDSIFLELDGSEFENLQYFLEAAVKGQKLEKKEQRDAYLLLQMLTIHVRESNTLRLISQEKKLIEKALADAVLYNRNIHRLGMAERYHSILKKLQP